MQAYSPYQTYSIPIFAAVISYLESINTLTRFKFQFYIPFINFQSCQTLLYKTHIPASLNLDNKESQRNWIALNANSRLYSSSIS